MEWISVKDRLPEDEDLDDYRLLIYGKTSCESCGSKPKVIEGRYRERDRKFEVGEYDCEYDVTHWMSLPKPPEENQ